MRLSLPILLGLLAIAVVPATASAAGVTIACAPGCSVAQGAEVVFNAAATGAVRDYAWDLDEDGLFGARDGEPEGPRATQARRAFPDDGRFLVAVRVRDASGVTSLARQLVTVAGPFVPPPLPPLPPGAGPALPVPPASDADDDGDGSPTARDACPTPRPAGSCGCAAALSWTR